MSSRSRDTAILWLRLVLKPVVRFCLRHSLKLQEIIEAAKVALVEQAIGEIKKSGKPLSVSKLNVMTGVHRPDIMRLMGKDSGKDQSPENIIMRVIGQWQSDHRFTTSGGRARTLDFAGKNSEFVRLVRSVSADLNPYAILFELERSDLVEKTARGLRLKAPELVISGDATLGFTLVADDADDLIRAVEKNVLSSPEVANLHLRTEYDNIGQSHLPAIRTWLLNEGTRFHNRARKFLGKFDKDINPRINQRDPSVRVMLGAFSNIDPPPEKKS